MAAPCAPCVFVVSESRWTSPFASILLLDGVTNGAVYRPTRAGHCVRVHGHACDLYSSGRILSAYGALTSAMLQTAKRPAHVWLLLILAGVAALMELVERWRHHGNVYTRLDGGFEDLGVSVVGVL